MFKPRLWIMHAVYIFVGLFPFVRVNVTHPLEVHFTGTGVLYYYTDMTLSQAD